MSDNPELYADLLKRLEDLDQTQQAVSKEIRDLRVEVIKLKRQTQLTQIESEQFEIKKESTKPIKATFTEAQSYNVDKQTTEKLQKLAKKRKARSSLSVPNLEMFIGENIISKIGILIVVVGVAIGAKYAIDNNLISPLVRILLGYLFGTAIVGTALKLKEKYHSFSALLLGGGLSIYYFLTYFAYSYYDLIGQSVAFALMVLFTVFTVIAALQYNKELIALLGMLGAYAVPFMLGDENGSLIVFLSYISLINLGLLFLAFVRYWKRIRYGSYVLSWLIFMLWFSGIELPEFIGIACFFAGFYFVTFYINFLAYKFRKDEAYSNVDILLTLSNGLIFYAIGYAIVGSINPSGSYLGLYTLGHAAIHLGVSYMFFRKRLSDPSLFYLTAALCIMFVTIAVPVQFEGNFISLIWSIEAALLYWIAVKKDVSVFQRISYILLALAQMSLWNDWMQWQSSEGFIAFANIDFYSSLLCIFAFGFVIRTAMSRSKNLSLSEMQSIDKTAFYLIGLAFISSLYLSFYLEIAHFWDIQTLLTHADSAVELELLRYNSDIDAFKNIWQQNYSLFFLTILSVFSYFKLNNKGFNSITLALNGIASVVYLAIVPFMFMLLRESYLSETQPYETGFMYIGIRYISYVFMIGLFYISHKMITKEYKGQKVHKIYDVYTHFFILVFASTELINLISLFDPNPEPYKFSMTILWALFALFLIGFGIKASKRHLRIAAIVLSAITLVKLIFIDMSNLESIAKTMLLVSVGLLLLVISFLYNKFKNQILNEES